MVAELVAVDLLHMLNGEPDQGAFAPEHHTFDFANYAGSYACSWNHTSDHEWRRKASGACIVCLGGHVVSV